MEEFCTKRACIVGSSTEADSSYFDQIFEEDINDDPTYDESLFYDKENYDCDASSTEDEMECQFQNLNDTKITGQFNYNTTNKLILDEQENCDKNNVTCNKIDANANAKINMINDQNDDYDNEGNNSEDETMSEDNMSYEEYFNMLFGLPENDSELLTNFNYTYKSKYM